MNLYIVRHAHAENGHPDHERKLREYGRIKLSEMLPHWKKFIPKIDVILSSPYKRALETAQIIHSNYPVEEDIIVDNGLQPGMNIADVIITVDTLKKENVMIVGHMPDVMDLLTAVARPPGFEYQFSPGTLAAVEFNGEVKKGKGKLKLLIPERN